MSMKAYTNLEQSKALLEKGLSANTADMYYSTMERDANIPKVRTSKLKDEEYPCWSAVQLMALLPEDITVDKNSKRRKTFHLSVEKYERYYYNVAYCRTNYISDEIDVLFERSGIENIVESLTNTLLWVLENNYQDNDLLNEIAAEL